MNIWAALEHRALLPVRGFQQPLYKTPAVVQTEEPILKFGGQERNEVRKMPHGVTHQSQMCLQGLGRLQITRTSSPLAALGQP